MRTSALLTPLVATPPPDAAGAEGVEGNARLTAALGLLLTVLLLVEGVTVLSVRRLITVHIAIGLVLLAPVAVKVGTTTYRFARYYLADEEYVRRGPPPLVLRVIGPAVVLSTVALLATGVALLFRHPGNAGAFLFLHKASFVIWVVLMTVHFLGHLVEAVGLTARELTSRRSAGSRAAGGSSGGRGVRLAVVVVTLLVGVGIAAAATPGNTWSGRLPQHEHDARAAHR